MHPFSLDLMDPDAGTITLEQWRRLNDADTRKLAASQHAEPPATVSIHPPQNVLDDPDFDPWAWVAHNLSRD